jgi:hypothetical protein
MGKGQGGKERQSEVGGKRYKKTLSEITGEERVKERHKFIEGVGGGRGRNRESDMRVIARKGE